MDKLLSYDVNSTIFFSFKGFAETMKAMQLFGLVDPNPHPSLHPDGPELTWVSLYYFNPNKIFLIT